MVSRHPEVAARFKPLTLDAETQAFLNTCKPSYMRSVAATMLRMVYSLTDTNAILNRAQATLACDWRALR